MLSVTVVVVAAAFCVLSSDRVVVLLLMIVDIRESPYGQFPIIFSISLLINGNKAL